MLDYTVRFLGLFAAGVAAGIAVGVFLMGRVWAGTGQFYTELMQLLNRALTVPAPALGALGFMAIGTDTVLLFKGGEGVPAYLGVAALALALVALVVTKLGLFPINDQVLTWKPTSPPADWTRIQARWSALHVVRTIAALGSFGLFLLSNVLR